MKALTSWRGILLIGSLTFAVALFGCGDDTGDDGDGGGTPDTTPPTIIDHSPADNAMNVASDAAITITFSEAINLETIACGVERNASEEIGPTWSDIGNNTIRADLPRLGYGHELRPWCLSGAGATQDLAGNELQDPLSFSFQVEAAPFSASMSPADGSVNMLTSRDSWIWRAEFNADVDPATATTANFYITGAGGLVPGAVHFDTGNNRAMSFQPDADLDEMTEYTLTLTTGVMSTTGVNNAARLDHTFTTGDFSTPVFVSSTPSSSASGVAVDTTLEIVFSEPMDQTLLMADYAACTGILRFHVTADSTTCVPGAITFNTAGDTLTLTPTSNLANGTYYSVNIGQAAADLAGNETGILYGFGFSTTP